MNIGGGSTNPEVTTVQGVWKRPVAARPIVTGLLMLSGCTTADSCSTSLTDIHARAQRACVKDTHQACVDWYWRDELARKWIIVDAGLTPMTYHCRDIARVRCK
jgi:hypothetical protein